MPGSPQKQPAKTNSSPRVGTQHRLWNPSSIPAAMIGGQPATASSSSPSTSSGRRGWQQPDMLRVGNAAVNLGGAEHPTSLLG